MSHAHETNIRTVVFLLASAALVATALYARPPAPIPGPNAAELETQFRASVLPQPETGCTVKSYNAKGGMLAKPELTCTVNNKQVKRLLPDLSGGKTPTGYTYHLIARPNEDTVLLAGGPADTDGPTLSPEFWFYSFKTWKLTPFAAATELGDVDGWQSAVVSPDAQRVAWIPTNTFGMARGLYVMDLVKRTVSLRVENQEGAALAFVPGRMSLGGYLGWKDPATILYGVGNLERGLTELREVSVQ